MDQLQLEDLVYTYPDQNEPGFQTLISAKEEFRVTASKAKEPVPRRGELFKHQQYLLRLMRQYDNQLVIWRTGTGKSCGVISVTEYYKSVAGSLENMRKDTTSPYKHAYVLVKGPVLVEEFKFQLVCKCTDGDYLNEAVLKSTREQQRKNNLTRSIKSFYSVMTYGTFARKLKELTDEQIKHKFDHSIFIIDEVHNLYVDTTIGKTIIDPLTGNKIVVKRTKSGNDKIIDKRLVYDQLHRAFHTLSPRKVMLLSATPMINDVSEIGPILNLILPMDKQIPTNVIYSQLTVQQIEPYMRGLISYVRELDTGAIPEYIGEVIDTTYDIGGQRIPSQMVINASRMSSHQEKTYNLTVSDPKALRPLSKNPEAFSDLQRQAANFVFPDGTTGSDGFKKYVTLNTTTEIIRKKKRTVTTYVSTPELLQYISNPETLRSLSTKFSDIIRLTKDTKGNSWCYSDFVVGSGAILLSLCFEAQGFEKFKENSSIFSQTKGAGLAPLCAPDKTIANRKINMVKKLRYGVLTSETAGSPEAAAMLEAFNSYENRNGEYIKVIIGSPVTRDGLNLANVLQIHLVGPGWNQSTTYQAESRAIRSTSHVDLIADEKKKLLLEGKNPDNAHVIIRVYRHAAVTSDGTSIDLIMYQLSEKKDRQIKRVLRMMKQISTDCQIQYGRNVRDNDVDGSAICDYDVCKYKCYDPEPTFIDYDSYDVLYIGDVISAITIDVKEIFNVKFNITFNDLYIRLKQYRPKFIDETITYMIENKIPINDRYGYTSYLREDKSALFLRRDYPLYITEETGAHSLSIYIENLIGIHKVSLNEYIGDLQKGEQYKLLAKLKTLDPTGIEFNNLIDMLTIEIKAEILEGAILQFANKSENEMVKPIIDKFTTSVFQVSEPVTSIKISAQALADRGSGRGRKAKADSIFTLSEKEQANVDNILASTTEANETVYIHTLSKHYYDRTSYSVASKSTKAEGKIRLLKLSENVGWRDANPYEVPVYNTIVQNTLNEMQAKYEIYDIYGTILEPDRNFRIRDKTTEHSELSGTDSRSINRGRTCTNWSKPNLINMVWKLKIMPFKLREQESREELVNYLNIAVKGQTQDIESFSMDKLRFFYTWYRTDMSIDQICELLKNELLKVDKVLIM